MTRGMCDGCGGLVRVVEACIPRYCTISQKRQNPGHLGLDHVSGARHSPAHRLDAVGAEGRSRRVRRRRGAREGLSPLSARGVGQAPAAAQPSRKSQPSSPDANPVQEVAGTVVRHGWVPLGPTERPPGARQTCFWALFQRSRANHSYNEPACMRMRAGLTGLCSVVDPDGVHVELEEGRERPRSSSWHGGSLPQWWPSWNHCALGTWRL